MSNKQLIKQLLVYVSIILILLPLLTTLSSFLTEVFMRNEWYVWLQRYISPIESRFVAGIIKMFKINIVFTPNNNYSMLLQKGGEYIPIRLEWNCLGWQSLVLIFITFISGLRGKYSFLSKILTVTFGLVGTLTSNILRMVFIVILGYFQNGLSVYIIHDYFAAFVTLIWLIFFWWFSYAYILEEKSDNLKK